MNGKEVIKRVALPILKKMQVDRLFRYLNRKKILILAYHGVTRKNFQIPPWTLIPLDAFEQQIKFIKRKYNVITLKQAIEGITNGCKLPENPAVITFDDGYKNNFTLALPVLEKYGMPATIFLTAGLIGSQDILPLDEVFLVITHRRNKEPVRIKEINLGPLYLEADKALLESYLTTVDVLKRFCVADQKEYIRLLKDKLDSDYEGKDVVEEFLMLSQEEVITLSETTIIDIGAHTVSHEILTNISLKEAEHEIIGSKNIIDKYLGETTNLFAYPNGAETDYNEEHIECLKKSGFICSVTTTPKLNDLQENPYRLGRMCSGPDYLSDLDHFALRTSGFIAALKSHGRHNYV